MPNDNIPPDHAKVVNDPVMKKTAQQAVAHASVEATGANKPNTAVQQVSNTAAKQKPSINKPVKKQRVKDMTRTLLIRAAILGVIDLAAFMLLIYFMGQTPFVVDKIKELAKQNITLNGNAATELTSQLNSNKTQIDYMYGYFPDEVGIVSFVKEIDQLRAQGIISSFELKSQDYIKDKTKSVGLPFIVVFSGSPEAISQGINRLQSLPYVVRAINVTVDNNSEGTYTLTYGGFLYVDENLGQN